MTTYTIHDGNHNLIAAYAHFDHAAEATTIAQDRADGKTRRFYLHNGSGVIAAFMTRDGAAHQILRNDYIQFGPKAAAVRADANIA